ncbi:alpha/beta hydrolase family protein [Robertkochia flava]|uniref:alpha/beta hydrolase family protein n=1 Tax=Robertkochia flava TaxID=3447986 RepID=UPI001CCE3FD1|nr:alpha/beta fold hydrolase [Robertkochia marina]
MITKTQHILEGKHERPIPLDLYTPKQQNGDLAVFCHGYKGFKDWGCWDLVAREFVREGVSFLKFNFSHNGGTIEQPIDFPDLEAFALNNFTKEMDDLQTVIEWVCGDGASRVESENTVNIHLIGHSRGGGIVTLKAAEENRVATVTSWAGVSDFKSRFADKKALDYWRANGVIYVENSRTKQQLPHYYQFYEDFVANEERFTIRAAATSLDLPHLIVHGTEDPTVDLKEAMALKSWNPDARLHVIEGADHVFGGKHPWEVNRLPGHLKNAVDATVDFIKQE